MLPPGVGFIIYANSDDVLTYIDKVEFGFFASDKATAWFVGSPVIGTQWEFSSNAFAPEEIEDGSYNVSVRSYDGAGNVRTLTNVGEVKIDTIDPEASLAAPAAGNYSGDLPFKASASDNGSGVGVVRFGYKRSGDTQIAAWLTGIELGGHWTYSLDTTKLSDGSYSITVRVLDESGNEKLLEDVVEIVVDNTPPTVSFVVPDDGNYSNGVLFNASSSDAGSGVMLMEFRYENSSVNLTWFEGVLLNGS